MLLTLRDDPLAIISSDEYIEKYEGEFFASGGHANLYRWTSPGDDDTPKDLTKK
jgi:hypothetical protein